MDYWEKQGQVPDSKTTSFFQNRIRKTLLKNCIVEILCCWSNLVGAFTEGGGGIEDGKGSRVSASWSRLLRNNKKSDSHLIETCVLIAHEMAKKVAAVVQMSLECLIGFLCVRRILWNSNLPEMLFTSVCFWVVFGVSEVLLRVLLKSMKKKENSERCKFFTIFVLYFYYLVCLYRLDQRFALSC